MPKINQNPLIHAALMASATFGVGARAAAEEAKPDTDNKPVAAATDTPDLAMTQSPAFKAGVRKGLEIGRELGKIDALLMIIEKNSEQVDNSIKSLTDKNLEREWLTSQKRIGENVKLVRDKLDQGGLDPQLAVRLLDMTLLELDGWNKKIHGNNSSEQAGAVERRQKHGMLELLPEQQLGLAIGDPVQMDIYSNIRPGLEPLFNQFNALMKSAFENNALTPGNPGIGRQIRDRSMQDALKIREELEQKRAAKAEDKDR